MRIRHAFLGPLLILVIVAVVPVLVLHGFAIQRELNLAKRQAELTLEADATTLASETSTVILRAKRMVAYVATRPEVEHLDGSRCTTAIDGIENVDPAFVAVLVLDAAGRPVCSSRKNADRKLPDTFADRDWFHQALGSTGFEMGTPRNGALVGRPILPMTQTVRDPDGKVRAVVVLSIDLVGLSQRWQAGVPTSDLEASLLNSEGLVLAHFPEPVGWIGQRYPDARPAAVGSGDERTPSRVVERARVPEVAWTVLVSRPAEPLYAIARQSRGEMVAVAVAVVALAVGVALTLAHRLASSLSDLSTTARAASAGRGTRADEHLPGMFRDVAIALNTMLAAREQAHERVEWLSAMHLALVRTNRAVMRLRDPQSLFEEICAICVDTTLACCAAVCLSIDGQIVRAAAAGEDIDQILGDGTGTRLAASPELIGLSLADDRRLVVSGKGKASGPEALGLFPIKRAGQPAGVLVVGTKDPAFFSEEMLQLFDEMAADLSFALDGIDQDASHLTAEREVALASSRLRTIIDALPVGVIVSAADDGTVVELNQTICGRYNVRREQALGKPFYGLPIGMEQEAWRALAARVREGEPLRAIELSVQASGGQCLELLVNAEPIEFSGQSCMLTATVDITKLKVAERTLARREQQLSSVVDYATDAIITVDATSVITVFNRAAARMFGLNAGDAVGMTLGEFANLKIGTGLRERLNLFVREDGESGSAVSIPEAIGLAADGSEFPIEATLMHVGDVQSAERLHIAVLRDVTAAVFSEQARQARLAAEEANRAKTQFLARVSHELRTPLNAVLGFSRLLQESSLTDKGADYAGHIVSAGRHLLELINDMLDISRIEAGGLRLDLRPVSTTSVLDEAVSMTQALAREHEVAVHPFYASSPTAVVRADSQRLRQVAVNLLSNAIKYNRPGGHVRLMLSLRERFAVIVVEDNGMGMSAEQLTHLFEPFNRLGRDRTQIEGTGIGMALTRQLVALMGGSIEVSSKPGLGTRVEISLARSEEPAEFAPAPRPGERSLDGLSGLVLYIEDNPVNAILLQQYFQRFPQLRVVVAECGADGIQLAETLRPDLVLLDMQLPDMDGTEVLETFNRRLPKLAKRTLALSASAMQEDVDRALAAGAAGYLTKPFDFEHLIAVVDETLASARD